MKRRQKAGFLRPRRKGGEDKKAMVAPLVFIIATLEIFGRKKLWDAKGPSGDNFFKNRARYINNWRVCQTSVYYTHILEKPDLPGTNLFGGIRLSAQTNN